MEFVSIKPAIEATVFDLPNVVPITKVFIDKERYSNRIKTYTGDCFTEQEVTDLLTSAGFSKISRLEFESGLSQMTAQKIL